MEDWIKKMVGDFLPEDKFLVEVILKGGDQFNKIKIIIDGDNGVDIDYCASLSRKISSKLDEEDFTERNYTLEVTSPGLDYPLKELRQYKKNINKKIRIFLNSDSTLEGKLLNIEEDKLVIETEEKKKGKQTTISEKEVPFAEIVKTIVVPSFK